MAIGKSLIFSHSLNNQTDSILRYFLPLKLLSFTCFLIIKTRSGCWCPAADGTEVFTEVEGGVLQTEPGTI